MRINEMHKKTGLSKKSVRIYTKKKLLNPDVSNPRYPEYTEEDLRTAILTKVLNESGLELSEIKNALDGEADLQEVLSSAIEKARKRIVRLEGCIRYLETMQLSMDNQYLLEPVFSAFTIADLLENGKFTDELDTFIDDTGHPESKDRKQDSSEEEDDPLNDREVMKILQVISYIPILRKKETPDGPNVQETLRRLYRYMSSLAQEEGEESVDAKDYVSFIRDILQDLPETSRSDLESRYGNGCIDYIFQAVDVFEKNVGMKTVMKSE